MSSSIFIRRWGFEIVVNTVFPISSFLLQWSLFFPRRSRSTQFHSPLEVSDGRFIFQNSPWRFCNELNSPRKKFSLWLIWFSVKCCFNFFFSFSFVFRPTCFLKKKFSNFLIFFSLQTHLSRVSLKFQFLVFHAFFVRLLVFFTLSSSCIGVRQFIFWSFLCWDFLGKSVKP